MRDFSQWLSKFRQSIATYNYYVDFFKVYGNVEKIKIELGILGTLIGSKNIEVEFESIVQRYPEVIKCIPVLLAVRNGEIYAQDDEGAYTYQFDNSNVSVEQYKIFMRKTGLFELMEKRLVHSLYDYVTGVEVGLDSNGRKNRGGHLMENLVEYHLQKAGFIREETYFKEMKIREIEEVFGVDLATISNNGKTVKRFDFVVKLNDTVYGIETNFYASGGSKLNETARSYKQIAIEAKQINNFEFVWITDGRGWQSARNNLFETFEVLEKLYSLNDLEKQGIRHLLDE